MHALVTSWEWQAEDRILHCLPLHHVHGIINALYCAHAVGATVEFQPKFSPKAVWAALMVRQLLLSMPRHLCRTLRLQGISLSDPTIVIAHDATMHAAAMTSFVSRALAVQMHPQIHPTRSCHQA